MILTVLVMCLSQSALADVRNDSTEVFFRVSKTNLDLNLEGNKTHLKAMVDSLKIRSARDTLFELKKVKIEGSASPEGSEEFNYYLSKERARTIFDYFSHQLQMPDSITEFRYLGRDWNGLRRLVEADKEVPSRAKVLALLDAYKTMAKPTTAASNELLRQLKQLDGGTPYAYLLRNLFPRLRNSKLQVRFEYSPAPIAQPDVIESETIIIEEPMPVIPEPEQEPTEVIASPEKKPFYMDIRTNMLYDVAAVPNLGVEFYLGKNWSLGANWEYAWWSKDSSHKYWRLYGGELTLRKWFGKAAKEKPLTGHHVGLYAGIFTFDFEWGDRGYMGGIPGGSLWDRAMINAGIEYGYSLPVARRLNIDFTLGVGYVGGKMEKYVPFYNVYLWESTNRITWIGPTKAEISLVWLIGRGNVNERKGGGR